MGQDLAKEFRIARLTFEEADDAISDGLSRLCWEGPEEDLTKTWNAQPAILVHSIAVWRVLQTEAPLDVSFAAGHSLGEFSAYVAAGTMKFEDAVRTVRRRGELMSGSAEKRPGAMAAVLGLDDAAARALCERASKDSGGVVVPANYNSPAQLVISGDVAAVHRAQELAKEMGAKRVIPLNVSGAFHSPLMEIAVPGLEETLDSISLAPPSFPVISNVTAQPVSSVEEARSLLLEQLTSPVRWVDSIHTMRERGVERFFEIGPGKVLSNLVRRIDHDAIAATLGTAEELTAYLKEEG